MASLCDLRLTLALGDLLAMSEGSLDPSSAQWEEHMPEQGRSSDFHDLVLSQVALTLTLCELLLKAHYDVQFLTNRREQERENTVE